MDFFKRIILVAFVIISLVEGYVSRPKELENDSYLEGNLFDKAKFSTKGLSKEKVESKLVFGMMFYIIIQLYAYIFNFLIKEVKH